MCAEDVLVLCSRDTSFFSECELKSSSFGRKVFNSVFKSAFKMWNRMFLSFLVTQINFSRNLSSFCWLLGKSFRHFSEHSRIRVQNNVLVTFTKQRVFFQFFTLSAKLSDFERKFSEKPSFFPFSCAEDIWYFCPKKIFCFGLWKQIFWHRPKTFVQCFWKWIQDVQKNVLVVFLLTKVSFFLDPEQKFLAVWNKNNWHWSQKNAKCLCKGTTW